MVSMVLQAHKVDHRASIPLHLNNNMAVLHPSSNTARLRLTRPQASSSTVLPLHSKDTKSLVNSNMVLHLHTVAHPHTVVNMVVHLHMVGRRVDRRHNTKLLEATLRPDLRASKALEVSPLEDMGLTKQKREKRKAVRYCG